MEDGIMTGSKEQQRLSDHNKQLRYESEDRKREGFAMMKKLVQAGLAE